MYKEKKNSWKLNYLAYAMYFITGVVCMQVGSNMSGMIELYQKPVETIALITSAFAAGRTLSVSIIGKLSERKDPLKILFIGTIFVLMYLFGIIIPAYDLALLFAFLGGIGMSCQDVLCPILLSNVNAKNYSSALSAGQALFGLGGFSISLLTGYMFRLGKPFYYSNLILSFAGLSMLILIPFSHFNKKDNSEHEETVKPIYTSHLKTVMILLGLICFLYCMVCVCIGTYLTTYLESLGLNSSVSSYLLALYNLFSVGGSLAFAFILRKVSERAVLFINPVLTLFFLFLLLVSKNLYLYILLISLCGFFFGVLFGIILAVATRVDRSHIGKVGANMALCGSLGDILAPMINGSLFVQGGASLVFVFAIILLLIISILSGLVYRMSEER